MSTVEAQQEATELVDEFAARHKSKAFKNLHRSRVAQGLHIRIEKPYLINQGNTGLCVPASLVYDLAYHRPLQYAKLVTHLFEHGTGKIGNWELKPGYDLRHHALEANDKFKEADWIPMASIRDSENWFFDYESSSDNGGTTVEETLDMLHNAGYQHIINGAEGDVSSDVNLGGADYYRKHGYTVCLRIDSSLLEHNNEPGPMGCKKPIGVANHRVVLVSPIEFYPVKFKVFTWGKIIDIPRYKPNPLSITEFLKYYYGYMAFKY